MNLGFQHLSARRRLFSNLEPFPAEQMLKRGLDYLMYGVGIVQPVALVPQALSIYVHHETTGVSITTWLLLGVFNALWALYGAAHRDRPIFICNTLLTVLDLVIVFGVFLYR